MINRKCKNFFIVKDKFAASVYLFEAPFPISGYSLRLGVHLLGMELLNLITYCTEGKIITVYGTQKTPTPPAPLYGDKGKALKL
jgi:hypothetical protein